jgi:hypothetical protein
LEEVDESVAASPLLSSLSIFYLAKSISLPDSCGPL